MTFGRRTATAGALLAAASAVLLGGCGPKEPPVHERTVGEIDTQIQQVESNANMPPQAKSMALANLKREREIAAKRGGKQ